VLCVAVLALVVLAVAGCSGSNPEAASVGADADLAGTSVTGVGQVRLEGAGSSSQAPGDGAAAPPTLSAGGHPGSTVPQPGDDPDGGSTTSPDGSAGASPAAGDRGTGCPVFPADNWWNRQVDGLALHSRSAAWVSSIGDGNLHPDFGTVWQGEPIGIPFTVVDGSQPRVPVTFTYQDESDPGPYPIPPGVPVEAGSDHHVIVIDTSSCTLYELFAAEPVDGGASWRAGSGAVFDLRSNGLRPSGWTSADAAGLPIFPGLVTYEEVVVEGRIDHALRFTASRTQQAYIRPATHFASDVVDPGVPPMGARFRLQAGYDCGPLSREVQVICAAMKTYGMLLADNGSDWYVSGAPDERWDDAALADLREIPGTAFEVVDTGEAVSR
jgi:hypothetical protein